MFIEELKLSLFKGFRDFTLECSPFTCLVGLNSKGKTSVLQAVLLLHDLLVFAFGGKERPDFSSPRWQHNPSHGLNRLSFGDPDAIWLQKKTSEPCKISAKLSGGIELLAEIKGRDRYEIDICRNGESIKSAIAQPENRRIIEDIFNLHPAYLPPVGAVSPTEDFMPEPQLRGELDKGRDSQYWRSRLYWLWNDGRKESYDEIVQLVQRYLPEAEILPPRLTHDNPPRVLIEFEEEDTTFDISASGGGLRTLLNLASVLHFSRSQCILCDEPDSHLHGSLQAAVARMLLDFSIENGCQVLVATHAPDCIAEVPVDSIVWIDRTQKEGHRCERIGQVLSDLGSISKADAVRACGVDKVLLVEGSLDRNVLGRLFDLGGGQNPFSDSKVLVACLPDGKSSVSHLQMFQKLLVETFKLPVTVACITDNDYELPKSKVPSDTPRDTPLLLSLERKEVENYLLEPSLLAAAIRASAKRREEGTGKDVKVPNKDTVAEVLTSNLTDDEVRNIVRWQVLPRYRQLLDSQAADSTKERSADEWFEKQWADKQWRIRNCPGKVVLKRMRQWCQEKWCLTLTPKTLIEAMSECPSDIAKIVQAIQKHFYGGTTGA